MSNRTKLDKESVILQKMQYTTVVVNVAHRCYPLFPVAPYAQDHKHISCAITSLLAAHA